MNLIKDHIGIYGIGIIWNYLFNQAVNAAVKQLNGKEGKGSYMWLHRCSDKMDPVLVPPVLEQRCSEVMGVFDGFIG